MKYYFISYSFNAAHLYGMSNVTLSLGGEEIFSVREVQKLIVAKSNESDTPYTKIAIINFQRITKEEFDIESKTTNQ